MWFFNPQPPLDEPGGLLDKGQLELGIAGFIGPKAR
jgi:hypothetical protein